MSARPVYLVTGATSGIGRAAALELAGHGRVLVGARDPEAGESVRAEIAGRGGEAEVALADLSVEAQVRDLAARVLQREERLDVLVNNAGVFCPRRRVSPDGRELTLAVNYLAPVLLCHDLLPLLRSSAPARIVNVASMEHRLGRIRFEDPELERGYGGFRAYRQSKLALVLFTRELARRLDGTGVTANALHPGVIYSDLVRTVTPLARLARWLLKTPEEGAATLVHLATSPDVEEVNGAYFRGRRRARLSRRARDPETARRLWGLTERLTGIQWSGN